MQAQTLDELENASADAGRAGECKRRRWPLMLAQEEESDKKVAVIATAIRCGK